MAKRNRFAVIGEGYAAGVEQGSGSGIPRTVLSVTDQRKSTAGKLHPDLMASAGVEPHPHQGCLAAPKPCEFQPGFFDTLALLFYHEYLILAAVFE